MVNKANCCERQRIGKQLPEWLIAVKVYSSCFALVLSMTLASLPIKKRKL